MFSLAIPKLALPKLALPQLSLPAAVSCTCVGTAVAIELPGFTAVPITDGTFPVTIKHFQATMTSGTWQAELLETCC